MLHFGVERCGARGHKRGFSAIARRAMQQLLRGMPRRCVYFIDNAGCVARRWAQFVGIIWNAGAAEARRGAHERRFEALVARHISAECRGETGVGANAAHASFVEVTVSWAGSSAFPRTQRLG